MTVSIEHSSQLITELSEGALLHLHQQSLSYGCAIAGPTTGWHNAALESNLNYF